MYEIMWNVTEFSDRNMWPTDGRKPFVYAMNLGYDEISLPHLPHPPIYNPTNAQQLTLNTISGSAAHGDYMFGWEGDSLQRAMDSGCNLNQNCPAAGLTVQQPNVYNNCKVGQSAPEAVDGCKCPSLAHKFVNG
jgi:hypothetical protein